MKTQSFFLVVGVLAVMLAAVPAVHAQSSTMAYQGYLTDADGNPLGGPVNLAFSIYASPSGGTASWGETQTNVRLDDGVFSVMLGSVEPLDGVEFDRPHYLGVTVNGGEELTPRVPMGAAPVSLYAHEVARGAAVHSISIDGGTRLTNDIMLEGGDNVTLSEADGIITIDAEAGAGLALPFEAQAATDEPALQLTNTGIGATLSAISHGAGPALQATTTGGGISLFTSTTGSGPALQAVTSGVGFAGFFRQFNTESSRPALIVTTDGQGSEAGRFVSTNAASDVPALSALSAGLAEAAFFKNTNPNSARPTVVIEQEDLAINGDEFFNDGLIIQGEAPLLTLFGKRFEQNTRSGLVLAGVDDNGTVQDRWGIVRHFFPGVGLDFTFGSDPDPTQNPAIMGLFESAEGFALSVSGSVRGERMRATEDLGASSTPSPGGVYRDNVVYAWAAVSGDGTLADGFGIETVERLDAGQYRITLARSLPNGTSVIATPRELGAPALASVATDGSTVEVLIRRFIGGTFDPGNNHFYLQVVGRP